MALTTARLTELLTPYTQSFEIEPSLSAHLITYLDLLLRWNARTNLTAIRDPEEIVQRHFGESLFTGIQVVNLRPTTVLDFGSGAGFPGLPIQLLLPSLKVTLAESQNKKATFLREAVRTLGLSTEIWPTRVETMPPTRTFDIITLRAVDNMAAARAAAIPRLAPTGTLVTLGTETENPAATIIPMPNTAQTSVILEPASSLQT